MFHICALTEYLNSRNITNKRTCNTDTFYTRAFVGYITWV